MTESKGSPGTTDQDHVKGLEILHDLEQRARLILRFELRNDEELEGSVIRGAFEDDGLAFDAHHPPPRWEGHGARLGDQHHRAVHWLPQSPAR